MSILLDGGKKTGRGTLKGIAAVAKRGMHQKLKIEFSAKRGGPCGENRRTFVDEVNFCWCRFFFNPIKSRTSIRFG